MAEKPKQEVQQVAILAHTYDDIQEYDNPMPGWWSFMFVASIVWSVVYFVGISLGLLPDYETDLRAEMAIQASLEAKAAAAAPPLSTEDLLASATDPDKIARGETVYKMNCAVCHGNAGEGLIGPNLTDNAWIVGDGSVASIHQVVVDGTDRGMPPWGRVLVRDDLVAVTGFVTSLQGTNPPNPKPPEGNVIGGAGEQPADPADPGEDGESG